MARDRLQIGSEPSDVRIDVPVGVDLPMLLRRLHRLGLDAQRVAEPVGIRSRPRGRGIVVGFGGAVEAAAEMYATAFGRPFRRCSTITEVCDLAADHASVLVIVAEADLTLSMCNRLVDAFDREATTIGVLPVGASIQAATEAVARVIGLELATRTERDPVRIYSDVLPQVPAIDGVLGYGATESEAFLRAAAEPSDALVIHTHSNGADLKIGRSVLCAQIGSLAPAPGQPGEHYLPCQGGGPCLREKRAPRSFVGPDAINGRLVAVLACTAFVAAGSIVDARFGFVNRLLQGASVQGIVASLRVQPADPRAALIASARLAAGESTGTLAKALNGSVPSGAAYLCIGDPELTREGIGADEAETRRIELPDPTPNGPHGETPSASDVCGRNVGVVRWRRTLIEAARCDRLLPAADALAVGLLDGWARLGDSEQGFDTEAVDRDLCLILGSAASEGAYTHRYWGQTLALRYEQRLDGRTHHCGGPLFRHDAVAPPEFAGADRWLWICGRCGIVCDSPRGIPMPALAFDDGHVEIDCDSAITAEGAFVIATTEAVGAQAETTTELRHIHGARDSGPIRIPMPPRVPMPGIRFFAVVMAWRGRHLVVRTPIPLAELRGTLPVLPSDETRSCS